MIKKIRLFESCAISLGMLGFIIFSGFGISYAATLTTVCNDSNITAGSGVSDSAFCKDKSTTDPVIGTLNLVTNLITGIAGFVAVVMIIISGFKMVFFLWKSRENFPGQNYDHIFFSRTASNCPGEDNNIIYS